MRNPIRQQTTDRRNTMAGIAWDNKKHYFGGAEHPPDTAQSSCYATGLA